MNDTENETIVTIYTYEKAKEPDPDFQEGFHSLYDDMQMVGEYEHNGGKRYLLPYGCKVRREEWGGWHILDSHGFVCSLCGLMGEEPVHIMDSRGESHTLQPAEEEAD